MSCAAIARKSFRERNSHWREGKTIDPKGYTYLRIYSDSPYFSMAHNIYKDISGRVLEHRLVMATHLHRTLEEWEIVHHINGKRSDNRIDNLELLPGNPDHAPFIQLERRIKWDGFQKQQ